MRWRQERHEGSQDRQHIHLKTTSKQTTQAVHKRLGADMTTSRAEHTSFTPAGPISLLAKAEHSELAVHTLNTKHIAQHYRHPGNRDANRSTRERTRKQLDTARVTKHTYSHTAQQIDHPNAKAESTRDNTAPPHTNSAWAT